MLTIKNLSVSIDDKNILNNINLQIKPGEVHVLMGPNGVGKSTLAMSLMKSSKFKVQSSKFSIGDEDLSNINTEERVKKGLFITFQNPIEIEGISVLAFLRAAYNSTFPDKKLPLKEFKKKEKKSLNEVLLDESFMGRSVNDGFSGGEKKRLEIAQILILKPKFAVLDEIDSGLDVDNLKNISSIIKNLVKKQKTGILLITHQSHIFKYLRPDFLHILKDGKLIDADCTQTIKKIERYGYAAV